MTTQNDPTTTSTTTTAAVPTALDALITEAQARQQAQREAVARERQEAIAREIDELRADVVHVMPRASVVLGLRYVHSGVPYTLRGGAHAEFDFGGVTWRLSREREYGETRWSLRAGERRYVYSAAYFELEDALLLALAAYRAGDLENFAPAVVEEDEDELDPQVLATALQQRDAREREAWAIVREVADARLVSTGFGWCLCSDKDLEAAGEWRERARALLEGANE